ncbi:MAG: DUF3107 domain-containing protein [Beutenbergiaceae bacterium]
MEITIGVRDVPRELSVEINGEADEVVTQVSEALKRAAAGDAGAVLDLTDERGNRVLVPASSLGYVQIGAQEPRRVGFGGG